MNMLTRYSQWGGQGTTDPVRQILDRLFEGNFAQGGSRDESSVVTSQWIPLVDIKEEQDRFILYADIPGVDP
jgi:HSP20 family protein